MADESVALQIDAVFSLAAERNDDYSDHDGDVASDDSEKENNQQIPLSFQNAGNEVDSDSRKELAGCVFPSEATPSSLRKTDSQNVECFSPEFDLERIKSELVGKGVIDDSLDPSVRCIGPREMIVASPGKSEAESDAEDFEEITSWTVEGNNSEKNVHLGEHSLNRSAEEEEIKNVEEVSWPEREQSVPVLNEIAGNIPGNMTNVCDTSEGSKNGGMDPCNLEHALTDYHTCNTTRSSQYSAPIEMPELTPDLDTSQTDVNSNALLKSEGERNLDQDCIYPCNVANSGNKSDQSPKIEDCSQRDFNRWSVCIGEEVAASELENYGSDWDGSVLVPANNIPEKVHPKIINKKYRASDTSSEKIRLKRWFVRQRTPRISKRKDLPVADEKKCVTNIVAASAFVDKSRGTFVKSLAEGRSPRKRKLKTVDENFIHWKDIGKPRGLKILDQQFVDTKEDKACSRLKAVKGIDVNKRRVSNSAEEDVGKDFKMSSDIAKDNTNTPDETLTESRSGRKRRLKSMDSDFIDWKKLQAFKEEMAKQKAKKRLERAQQMEREFLENEMKKASGEKKEKGGKIAETCADETKKAKVKQARNKTPKRSKEVIPEKQRSKQTDPDKHLRSQYPKKIREKRDAVDNKKTPEKACGSSEVSSAYTFECLSPEDLSPPLLLPVTDIKTEPPGDAEDSCEPPFLTSALSLSPLDYGSTCGSSCEQMDSKRDLLSPGYDSESPISKTFNESSQSAKYTAVLTSPPADRKPTLAVLQNNPTNSPVLSIRPNKGIVPFSAWMPCSQPGMSGSTRPLFIPQMVSKPGIGQPKSVIIPKLVSPPPNAPPMSLHFPQVVTQPLKDLTTSASPQVSGQSDHLTQSGAPKTKFYLLQVEGKKILIPMQGEEIQPRAFVVSGDMSVKQASERISSMLSVQGSKDANKHPTIETHVTSNNVNTMVDNSVRPPSWGKPKRTISLNTPLSTPTETKDGFPFIGLKSLLTGKEMIVPNVSQQVCNVSKSTVVVTQGSSINSTSSGISTPSVDKKNRTTSSEHQELADSTVSKIREDRKSIPLEDRTEATESREERLKRLKEMLKEKEKEVEKVRSSRLGLNAVESAKENT